MPEYRSLDNPTVTRNSGYRWILYCMLIGLFVFIQYLFFTNINYNVFYNGKQLNFTGKDDFLPPFNNIATEYFVAPQYKTAGCIIPKSMSQLTINIMCYFYNSTTFLNNNQTLGDVSALTDRECGRNPDFRKLNDKQGFTRFAFIRDPFDRFLSFFLSKCFGNDTCWNCGDDMQCVARNAYKSLWNHLTPGYHRMTNDAYHAAPLSWYCDFDKDLDEYELLMIGPAQNERNAAIMQLANKLSLNNVPKSEINYFLNSARSSETRHSTHKSSKRQLAEQQLKQDSVVRDYLHKIYLYDYLIFPFDRSVLDEKYRTELWKILN